MSELPMWCDHIAFDKKLNDWRIKTPDPQVYGLIHPGWRFCPFCGCPKPEFGR